MGKYRLGAWCLQPSNERSLFICDCVGAILNQTLPQHESGVHSTHWDNPLQVGNLTPYMPDDGEEQSDVSIFPTDLT